MKQLIFSLAGVALSALGCTKQVSVTRGKSAPAAAEARNQEKSVLGFDPGMKSPRVLSLAADSGSRFESCLGPSCAAAGTGNYSLEAVGSLWHPVGDTSGPRCRPNSLEPFVPASGSAPVPCPFHFFWGQDSDGFPYARLKYFSEDFKAPDAGPGSIALFQGMVGDLGGVSLENSLHTPRIEDVESIVFQMRASQCRHVDGAAAKGWTRLSTFLVLEHPSATAARNRTDKGSGASGVGAVATPSEARSRIDAIRAAQRDDLRKRTETLSSTVAKTSRVVITLDLLRHNDAAVNGEDTEAPPASGDSVSIRVDGAALGAVPPGAVFESCQEPTKWIPVQIRLQEILAGLDKENLLEVQKLFSHRVVNFGMAVLRQSGRGEATVDVKGYTILGRKAAPAPEKALSLSGTGLVWQPLGVAEGMSSALCGGQDTLGLECRTQGNYCRSPKDNRIWMCGPSALTGGSLSNLSWQPTGIVGAVAFPACAGQDSGGLACANADAFCRSGNGNVLWKCMPSGKGAAALTYIPTGEPLEPMGFDPGFKKPKALSAPYNSNPHFPQAVTPQWICPAGQPCAPENPGSGYYNVVQDRINSDVTTWDKPASFTAGANAGKAGVTSFSWTNEGGRQVADLQVGNLHLDWNAEPGPYAGLQMNIVDASGFPGGMPMADQVALSSIRYVKLKMRALGCKPPRGVNPWLGGRVVYYLTSYSQTQKRKNEAQGFDMAITMLRAVSTGHGGWSEGAMAAPGRGRWECAHMNLFANPICESRTIDIDGPSWGISRAEDLNFRTSQTCDTAFPDNQPFIEYTIDVPRMLYRLVKEGFATVEFLKTANYTGGAVVGIEFFGPAVFRAQVMEHTIYRAKNPEPLETVLATMGEALGKVDPGFVASVDDFVWRDVLPVDSACTESQTAKSPCNSLTEYGKVCSNGGALLLCNNVGLTDAWFQLGSAAPCTPEQAIGSACSPAQLGQTCAQGGRVVVCTDRGYQGGDYAPDAWSAPAPAAPTQPQAFPVLAPGLYKDAANIHFETNGTSHCVLQCLEELSAKTAFYGTLKDVNAFLPNPGTLPGCSNSSVWCH